MFTGATAFKAVAPKWDFSAAKRQGVMLNAAEHYPCETVPTRLIHLIFYVKDGMIVCDHT